MGSLVPKPERLLTLGAHAQRGLLYSVCACVCVCLSVTSLTAGPLAYGYKVRYESIKCCIEGFRLVDFTKNTSFKGLFAHHNKL